MTEEPALRVPIRGIIAMLITVGAQLTIVGALAPILPLYVLFLGATPAQWGLMAGSGGFLMIFSEPVWGWLADRFGFRRPYIAARFGIIVGLWLLVLWPGMLLVVLWQLFTGLFEPTIGVLSRGYLVRAYVPRRQTHGLSLYLIVYSLSVALGSTVAGHLYQQVGPRAVFVFIAGVGTLGALASLFLLEPPPFPTPEPAKPGVRKPVQPVLNEGTLILGLVALLQFVGNRVVRNFLVLLAQQQAGLDASAAGILLGAFSLANICFLTVLARLDRRISLATRIILGLAAGAAGMVAYGLARNFAGLLLAVTVDALGWALCSPARIVLLGRLSPPDVYGWALGLHGAFENVGVLIGPLLAGFLWKAVGPAAPYQATALLLAGGAVVALRLRRQPVAAQIAY